MFAYLLGPLAGNAMKVANTGAGNRHIAPLPPFRFPSLALRDAVIIHSFAYFQLDIKPLFVVERRLPELVLISQRGPKYTIDFRLSVANIQSIQVITHPVYQPT